MPQLSNLAAHAAARAEVERRKRAARLCWCGAATEQRGNVLVDFLSLESRIGEQCPCGSPLMRILARVFAPGERGTLVFDAATGPGGLSTPDLPGPALWKGYSGIDFSRV